MTYKELTKTITHLSQRVRLLELLHKTHATITKSDTKKTAGEALKEVSGLWKDKPRTKRDLTKIRKRLFGTK